jgi:hypothetical protein
MGKLHVPAQSAFFWTTVPCYVYILFLRRVVGHRARRR